MQLQCWYCAKTVSNHVPDSTVFRATATCPECEQNRAERPEPSRKPCAAYSESTMWQDYCRNCGCRQDAHPEFVDRKPEGDAGQTESNALRAAAHRRALESQRAERAEEQLRGWQKLEEFGHPDELHRELTKLWALCEIDGQPYEGEDSLSSLIAHKLASRVEAERELLEAAEALVAKMDEVGISHIWQCDNQNIRLQHAVAKYREAK